ncbi:MAG: hypothetical protein QOH45_3699, partial [Pseudonocardiales bacterium]|nr:hypothetical protein [Pseudonocardiales bacterium]
DHLNRGAVTRLSPVLSPRFRLRGRPMSLSVGALTHATSGPHTEPVETRPGWSE